MAHVLVLEPSLEAAKRLGVVLEFAEHQVTVAHSTDEAREHLRRQAVDALILSTVLPDTTGFDVCAEVRCDELMDQPAVLLMGHHADPADVFRGLEAGADDFILQPYHPEDLLERLAAAIAHAAGDASPMDSQPAIVAVEGREVAVRGTKRRALNYLSAALEDMLDAARAEARTRDRRTGLADSFQLLQPTLDALDAELVLVDHDLRIVVANQAWRDAVEVADPHLPHHGVGRRFTDVCRRAFGVGEDWCRIVRGGIDHALEEGASNFQLEYRREAEHPRGHRQFRISVRPMSGEAREYVAVTHEALVDATPLRMSVGVGPDATALPRTTEVVGLLASGVVHRYGELLTSIRGYAQLAQRGLSGAGPAARHLEQLVETLNEAEAVTQRLLRVGRSTDEGVELDLNQTLRALLPVIESRMDDRLSITAELHGRLRARFADPGQLERLVANLVARAQADGPADAVVRLETRLVQRLPRSRRHSLGSVTSPAIEIRVDDSGRMLSDDEIEALLDPFQATGQTEADLGMATVCGIVSQNRGRIDVRSSSDGTSISVFLPAAADCSASVDRPPADAAPLVLVVEDEARVRELISSALEMDGYRVHAAEDGAVALEYFEDLEEPLALLVTDVVMPGLDGRELAADLRQRQPDLPCVFVSGYIPELSSTDGSGHTRDRFLAKPFALDELSAAAAAALADEPLARSRT